VRGPADRAPTALPAAPRPAARRAVLALLRHGQSEFNRQGRFTGWSDVDLTPAGAAEAARAGRLLQHAGYRFDRCCTSVLRRASRTAAIVLRTMGLEHVPVEQSWRLNERHCGALEGMRPLRAVLRFGLLTVLRCRRQFAVRPPALTPDDPRFPGHDRRYADLRPDELPRTESFADTLARLQPYWEDYLAPQLRGGRNVLVVSHKNTLRLLTGLVEGRAATDRWGPGVRTGVPIVFELDATLAVCRRQVLREGKLASTDAVGGA
jgi:2,3-bisphosphoglycerate-dependent phosphoglycerate mutase